MGEGFGGDHLEKLRPLVLLGLIFSVFALGLCGCGEGQGVSGPEKIVISPEADVAVKAVEAAIRGSYCEFLSTLDPLFVDVAVREVGIAPGEELGKLLATRFVERFLPAGLGSLIHVESDALLRGDKGTALLWGEMALEGGKALRLARDEALRIPMIRREGGWFVDMLGY